MAWPDVGPNQHAQRGGGHQPSESFPFMLPKSRSGAAQWPGPGNPQDTPRGRAWLVSKRRINNANPRRRKTYRQTDWSHRGGYYHHFGYPGGGTFGSGGKGK